MEVKTIIPPKKGAEFLQLSIILLVLFLTSIYSYLLFHTITEIFGVVIALSVFALVWNARRFLDNNYFIFIGVAFLVVGILDLLHTFAYSGMGVFPRYDANIATQLWLAGRYLAAVSFLAAPFFIGRKLNDKILLATYLLVSVLLILSIFYWRIFPAAYVEGQGLTTFKKISEYIISFLFLGAILYLYQKRNEFNKKVLRYLIIALIFSILTEFTFTLYLSVFDYINLTGHLFRVISRYFIYLGVISIALKKPYDLLYKKSHDKLEETERRYEELWNNAPVAYHTLDAEGIIINVNKTEANMLGYNREEMIGRPIFDFISAGQRNEARKRYKMKLLGKRVPAKENRKYVKKDGTEIYVSITDALEKNEEGGVIGSRTTMMDVTEQKKAEKALKEYQEHLEELIQDRTAELSKSELRLARSQEIAHLGSWELDLKKNKLTWSNEVYRIFGLEPQEFGATYEAFLEHVHPDDRIAVHDTYAQSLRDNKDTYEIEHRVVRKGTGQIRVVHEKCEHFRDESGKIIRSVGMVHDITERKKAEEQINHFASFPKLNPNPVIELNTNGDIIFNNEATEKILNELGLPKNNVRAFLPDNMQEILEALKNKKNIQFYKEVNVGDRIFAESIYPETQFNTIRIFASDITNHAKTEEALRKLTIELDNRVKERTRELKEANVKLQEEMNDRLLAEQKVFESYRYLGTINRQIAIIAELNKNNVFKSEQEIIRYILESAIKISQANLCAFYFCDDNHSNLFLASVVGATEKEKKNMSVISLSKFDILKNFSADPRRIQGLFKDYDFGNIGNELKMDYFLLLPVMNGKALRGALFLGFLGRESLTTQELDFYEVFASQASLVFARFNIIK